MTRKINGLSEILEHFDAVLIDQFGVLHDGASAFPGTLACLEYLAAARIPVVALSNSGKRSALNLARLERLGFAESLFRAVVTSGELAHARIAEWLDAGHLPPRTPVAVISRDGDASMIEGLDVARVAPDAAPRLLIIAAAEPEHRTLESYLAELEPLARAGVPALCINPDKKIYANGHAAFGPGVLAEQYVAIGGQVEMLGKPGAEMFQAGLRALGNVPSARCLMIGDSPEHDIAGANAAGCKTLWIASGVQSVSGDVAADYWIERLSW